MDEMNYDAFIAKKQFNEISVGFKPLGLSPQLFDFQRAIVDWACRRGRAAIFADTGLGKTIMELEWAGQVADATQRPVLIVAPLCVAHQHVREGATFGVDVRYIREQCDVADDRIVITNYEMLDAFDMDTFGGVVLDECFAPDTEIDCLDGKKHIKDIRKGDIINNASGYDVVSDIHKREIKYAVKVFCNGNYFIASPNHPIFTQRGWVGAQDLQPGDHALDSREAVSMVRQDFCPEEQRSKSAEVLRDILLSEMADESAGTQEEGPQRDCCQKTRRESKEMACIGEPESVSRERAHSEIESYETCLRASENFIPIESHEPRTFRAWGQWQGNDVAAAENDGCVVRRMDSGVSIVTGAADSWISNTLQNRLGESREKNRYRGGWKLAPCEERERSKERREAGFIRVDGIEILESGNPELEQYRDADGKLYFYDIGATRHPSFSVNGLLVHNSSILKNSTGKTRNKIIADCQRVQYRLSATATPSPNDHMELGNQAEFLGLMTQPEMLAMFFTHDGGETQKWRLKGHGCTKFWQWMATWSVCIRKPSDLGHSDEGYNLPGLTVEQHEVESHEIPEGELFVTEALTFSEQRKAQRDSIEDRVAKVAELANADNEQWLVWCHLNDESDALVKAIDGAEGVGGSDRIESKEDRMMRFAAGTLRVLVTKPSIAGHGMNWQHCNRMAFVGLSHSFEQYYQAVRRCYRFGQKRPVQVHIVTAEAEGAIKASIERKQAQSDEMSEQMVAHMRELMQKSVKGAVMEKTEYSEDTAAGENWTLHMGDCVKVCERFDDDSLDYTVFSPPFASLYTYSNSDYDMGNCKDDSEFFEQFEYLVADMLRATKPGREVSFHCMNLPTSKANHGYIGIRDFRGELIRLFEDAGWIFHSEVCIWKDPVTAMQRTKALGLLWKQIKKDSAMSRQGIPDYLVTMRKPGENPDRIAHTPEEFPVDVWQKMASPVWMDINPSRTLQYRAARHEDDERHIAPLQLDVIERALMLWSRKGDLVFSPFAGIGSEGYCALKMGRRFVGSELKPSYWHVACKNLDAAERAQGDLFNAA